MKLVEILAINWSIWPAEQAVEQTSSGYVFSCTKGQHLMFGTYEMSEDQDTAVVTRTQWEAERARIAAMEGISAFSQEQENAETEREQNAKYEQVLWDKVATRLFCEYISEHKDSCYFNKGHATNQAFEFADAFMAERAKRLKSSS